jgi:hypothetical protein
MKKPLFANSRTFSGKLVAENMLGVSIDQDDEKITEKIYDYYKNFDSEKFDASCEKFLQSVLNDEKDYIDYYMDYSLFHKLRKDDWYCCGSCDSRSRVIIPSQR